jgi:hypothetical protein
MFEDDHNEPSADPCPLALSQIIRVPERLVGLGFRHWFAGYQSGDVHCWETAWGVYERALGEKGARLAVAELSSWVKAVRASARRDITVFHGDCRSFCRDECLAVAMVAACQHNTCPALKACTFALIESSMIDEVMHHTESYSAVMRSLDQTLAPQSIRSIGHLAGANQPAPRLGRALH